MGASARAIDAMKPASRRTRMKPSQRVMGPIKPNAITMTAVFGGPENPSGLWKEVGPARAKAKGIAPAELEESYRNRNLLKARVTPEHIGRAVVFFAAQETPTTGAVLPVDGGLPDAFPR